MIDFPRCTSLRVFWMFSLNCWLSIYVFSCSYLNASLSSNNYCISRLNF